MAYERTASTSALNDIKKRIAESEGFPFEKIDEFVSFLGDEPYITSAGLQFKMLQTYKAGKFAVQALIPTDEEYALVRRMMGLKNEDPLVVMRAEVWVEGFERPFADYGTASPKNLKGFVRFSDYPLEMATRRATNRAMRLATATGMCSVDEAKAADPDTGSTGSAGPAKSRPAGQQGTGRDEPATQAQIDLVKNLGRSSLLTEEERAKVDAQIKEGISRREASESIEHLKTTLEARRANGRAAEQKPAGETKEEPAQGTQEGTTGKAAGNMPHAEFLETCQKAEKYIGSANYTAVIEAHGVTSAHEVAEDDQERMVSIVAALHEAQSSATMREEKLKQLVQAAIPVNGVRALSQESKRRFGTENLEHLTRDQALALNAWIGQQAKEKAKA